MNLTKNFTLEALVHSDYADSHKIENIPTDDVVYNLTALAQDVLQPARDLFGGPININSGFRCKKVNDGVGSKDTSQHMIGQAADLDCSDNKKLFNLIKDNLIYDQLIDEKGLAWVHVSYKPHGGNRKQILKIK
jgi:zinc D-Ala-D-Ala carboxypeptidase